MLVNLPTFRSRLQGYDRLQVDNYVRWAETEILSARREVDDLANRHGLCVAEVEVLRQLAAESPEGRQLHQVGKRIGEMLRLAAEEAEERRRAAREVEEVAVAKAEALHAEARAAREQADAEAVRSRAEAARLLDEASAERDRLAEQAAAQRNVDEERARAGRDAMLAEVSAQVSAMKDELADLGNQRDQARQCLSRLAGQIGQALDALAEGLPPDVRLAWAEQHGPREHVLAANVAARP